MPVNRTVFNFCILGTVFSRGSVYFSSFRLHVNFHLISFCASVIIARSAAVPAAGLHHFGNFIRTRYYIIITN